MVADSSQPSAADYVVVGAGSAGCVLADRLSAAGDRSVLFNWLTSVLQDLGEEGLGPFVFRVGDDFAR
jgi:flavin-dependent dehydrogenase